MIEQSIDGTDAAGEVLADLQNGLDSAKRLVERTRLLLSGGAPCEGDALATGAAQAARERCAETVRKPAGE